MFVQVGEFASSKSAMNIRAPELSALMTILRSIGPVISTRRSSRSAGTGATVQSVLADLARLGQEVGQLAGRRSARCRSARRASSSRRRGPEAPLELGDEVERLGGEDPAQTQVFHTCDVGTGQSGHLRLLVRVVAFAELRARARRRLGGRDDVPGARRAPCGGGGGGGSARRSAAVPVSLDQPIPAPQSRKQTRHLLIVSYLGSEVDEASGLSTLSFSKPIGFGSIPRLQRWRPARISRAPALPAVSTTSTPTTTELVARARWRASSPGQQE